MRRQHSNYLPTAYGDTLATLCDRKDAWVLNKLFRVFYLASADLMDLPAGCVASSGSKGGALPGHVRV